jgi:hypothetical protein
MVSLAIWIVSFVICAWAFLWMLDALILLLRWLWEVAHPAADRILPGVGGGADGGIGSGMGGTGRGAGARRRLAATSNETGGTGKRNRRLARDVSDRAHNGEQDQSSEINFS